MRLVEASLFVEKNFCDGLRIKATAVAPQELQAE
jgi:hypothetical protein